MALAIALFFWVPILTGVSSDGEVSEKEESTSDPEITFTPEEWAKIRETEEIGELLDVAGEILRRKAEGAGGLWPGE